MVFAVAVFSVAASAQDAASSSSDSDDKSVKTERRGYGRHGGMGKGKHGARGGGYMRGLRGANLTDAQKEQLRVIHAANRPDQATMEEMRTLKEAKRGGTLTADQKEKFKALRQQTRANHEQVRLQVLAILTPEQRQQIELKQQEMKQRREERRNQRRENRGTTTDTPTDN